MNNISTNVTPILSIINPEMMVINMFGKE